MSNVSVIQPDIIKSISKQERSEFISLDGLQNNSFYQYTPTSGGGTNQLVFTYQPPNTRSIMDLTLLLKMDITATVAKGTGGADNVKLGKLALESHPINKMVNSLKVTINGTQLDSQPSRFMTIYERTIGNLEFKKRYTTFFPNMLNNDGFSYNSMTDFDAAKSNSALLNPFSDGSVCGDQFTRSRFVFPHVDTLADGTVITDDANEVAGSKKRKWTVVEPLFLNSFLSEAKASGIANINQITVTLNFESNPERFVICNPLGVTVDGAAIPEQKYCSHPLKAFAANTYLGAASSDGDGTGDYVTPPVITLSRSNEVLMVTYVNPSVAVPEQINLPYHTITPYTQQFTDNLHDGTGVTKNLNSIKENQVPSLLYIYARPTLGSKSTLVSDCLFPISRLSLQVASQQGILAEASQEQLYLMSVRNGYTESYQHWCSSGCVVILRMGQDLPGSPGLVSQFNLGITISYSNPHVTPCADITVECLLVKDGVLSIKPNSASLTSGMPPSALANAMSRADEDDDMPSDPLTASGMYGNMNLHGGSFRSFWRGVKRQVINPLWNQVGKPLLNQVLQPGGRNLLAASSNNINNSLQSMLAPKLAIEPAKEPETGGRMRLAGSTRLIS